MTEKILKEALMDKAHQMAVISTDKISFTKEVVSACEANYCGKYNTCWTCPPAVGDLKNLEKKYKKFKNALVFTTLHKLEDSFDIEGMDNGRIEHTRIEKKAINQLKGINIDWLGAGSCSICEKCTYPDKPCISPDKAKPSVEACGIDVVQLAKTCDIRYHNGENTVTYFSVIFYN